MIHKLGLIHRNIKAENILMHSSNGSIKIKIADFETVQTVQNSNLEEESCGNLLNIAPEIILNYQVITNKVDMWSYGVVLFQLATHEYPFKAKTNHKFQKKMRHMKSIERPLEIKDDLLWDLISQLLEFDPIKRLSAAEALLHPFFTSPQALAEISDSSRIIAANSAVAFKNGDKKITQFDLDQTFIVPTSEIKIFLNIDPEAEEKKILASQTNPQQQQQKQSIQIQNDLDNPSNQFPSILITNNNYNNLQNEIQHTIGINQFEQQDSARIQLLSQNIQNNQQEKEQEKISTDKQENITHIISITPDKNKDESPIMCDQCNEKIPYCLYQAHFDDHQIQLRRNGEEGIQCPFCNENHLYFEISDHIHEAHPDREKLYQDIKNIQSIIKQETYKNFWGFDSIQKGKVIQCPFCQSQIDASLIAKHVNQTHKGEDNDIFDNINYNYELTSDIIEQERKKRKLEQNRQFKEGRILCPFCNNNTIASEIQDHIHSSHPDNEKIYQDIKIITLAIKQHTSRFLGFNTIKKGIKVECPFCLSQIEISKIKDHVNQTHDEEKEQFNNINRNIELTLSLTEKYEQKQQKEQKQKEKEEKKNIEKQLKKMNNELQQIDKYEKQEYDKIPVECPYCEEDINQSEILKHLKTEDIGWGLYYRETKAIFKAIQQKEIDNKDVEIVCPCCNEELEVNKIEQHIEIKHTSNNELEEYQDILETHENVRSMEEAIKKKFNKQRQLLNRRIQELKNRQQILENQKDKRNENDSMESNSIIQCHLCNESFPSNRIIIHLQTHEDGQELIKSIQELMNMLQTDQKDQTVQCPFCQQQEQSNEMIQHITEKHNDKQDLFNIIINSMGINKQWSSSFSLSSLQSSNSLNCSESPQSEIQIQHTPDSELNQQQQNIQDDNTQIQQQSLKQEENEQNQKDNSLSSHQIAKTKQNNWFETNNNMSTVYPKQNFINSQNYTNESIDQYRATKFLQSQSQYQLLSLLSHSDVQLNTTWKKSDFSRGNQLGKGGFGTVWHMTESATSLEVAVKECEYYSNEEKQQVIEEINIMINVSNKLRKQVSNLSDIHIVQMLGYFFNEEDYKAYIVLEYCPEGDLRNYINKMKKSGMQIIIEKFYEMAGELAQSLNQLHSNGILHMDLKPENVLLTEEFKVKLADFGLARQLQISQHYTTNHAGTWQYQPPEKLQKNGVTEYTQIKEKVEKKEKEVKKDKKTKGDNHIHVHVHHHKDEINDQVDVKDNNELKIEKDKKMGKDQDKQKQKELDKQQMKEKEIEDLKDKIKIKEKQRKEEKEKEMNKKEKDYDEDLKDKHKEKEKEKKKEKQTEKDKKEKDPDEEQNIEQEKNREKQKEKENEKKKKNEYQKEKVDKKEEKKEKDLDDKLKDKEKEQEKENKKEKEKEKDKHNHKDKDKDKDEKQIVKENEKENKTEKEKDVDKDKHLDKDKHKHKDNEKEKQEKPKIHPQAAVDMWAFGVMLYELVAQRHPFFDFKSEGDIPIQEFINRVVNLPPAELPRIYPQELKDLIYQLLDKNPSRRITAEAILQLPDVAKTLQNKQQKKE